LQTQKILLVSILISTLLISSVGFLESADALTKASGKFTKKYGSQTKYIVCGYQTCEELEKELSGFFQQGRFMVGGVTQQASPEQLKAFDKVIKQSFEECMSKFEMIKNQKVVGFKFEKLKQECQSLDFAKAEFLPPPALTVHADYGPTSIGPRVHIYGEVKDSTPNTPVAITIKYPDGSTIITASVYELNSNNEYSYEIPTGSEVWNQSGTYLVLASYGISGSTVQTTFEYDVSFIVVSTDQLSYQSGDTIQVSGQVPQVLTNFPVVVSIINPVGTLVTLDQLEVKFGGTFSKEFETTSGGMWTRSGTYVVTAEYGPNDPIAETSFEFESVVELSVFTDKANYQPGDLMKIYGSVRNVTPDFPVEIHIFNPASNLVTTQQVQVNPDNSYSLPVTTGGALWNESGVYNIVASHGDPEVSGQGAFLYDSEFDDLTLQKWKIEDEFGNVEKRYPLGVTLSISADVVNIGDAERDFTFLVTISDEQGSVVNESYLSASLMSGEGVQPSLSWIPENSGEFTVVIQLVNNLENRIDLANPLDFTTTIDADTCEYDSSVQLDKPRYTWTDTVYITIVSPCENLNPNGIDEIGTGNTKIMIIAADMLMYRLTETGMDTGIFEGSVLLTGVDWHDADGDGQIPDVDGITDGTGPHDGTLEAFVRDTLTVDFISSSASERGSADIIWNDATVELNKLQFFENEVVTITVSDSDMNFKPDLLNNVKAKITSDSDPDGIELLMFESQSDTGEFVNTITLTTSPSTSNTLQISSGDEFTVEYLDCTAPESIGVCLPVQVTATVN